MKVQNFLIGPGRSGTSFIYNALLRNNFTGIPHIKEPQFFDRNFHRGIEWYHSLYPNSDTPRWDFSNRYYLDPAVIKRIFEYNKHANIFFIERDQKDLFRSFMYFELRKGKSKKEIIALFPKKFIETDMKVQLAPWKEYFDIHVISFKEITENPQQFFENQFGICNINLSGVDTNASLTPRYKIYGILAKSVARKLRKFGFFRILSYLKRSSILKYIFFADRKVYWLDRELKKFLTDYDA